MKMREICYFLALCEERNFTRAAKRCDVAQPTLTRAIKSLETKLGGALFFRSHTETRLTELGNLVKPRLHKIRLETERAHEAAQKFCMGWNELNQKNKLPAVQKMHDMSFVVLEAD